jgi:hypothetical protein
MSLTARQPMTATQWTVACVGVIEVDKYFWLVHVASPPNDCPQVYETAWSILSDFVRRGALTHESIMVLFQIYFQSFQILVVVRQVGGLLLCHVLIPQSFLMVSLIMFKGLNDKSNSLR